MYPTVGSLFSLKRQYSKNIFNIYMNLFISFKFEKSVNKEATRRVSKRLTRALIQSVVTEGPCCLCSPCIQKPWGRLCSPIFIVLRDRGTCKHVTSTLFHLFLFDEECVATIFSVFRYFRLEPF